MTQWLVIKNNPKAFIFAAIFLSANYFRLQSIQQVINSIIASLVVVAVMARESTNDDQLVRLIDHNVGTSYGR